jgi:hypothetical protein
MIPTENAWLMAGTCLTRAVKGHRRVVGRFAQDEDRDSGPVAEPVTGEPVRDQKTVTEEGQT